VLSIASMVGFVTLFGIAVRNGILLVNHYQHLMAFEGCEPEAAVLRGSVERLVPILMTALTAALGLLPLALAHSKPGSELLAPLATVVLGGLVSSTVLNLFVVPAAYSFVAARARQSLITRLATMPAHDRYASESNHDHSSKENP
jgi:Cu/Ag efflux pump CusA